MSKNQFSVNNLTTLLQALTFYKDSRESEQDKENVQLVIDKVLFVLTYREDEK